MDADFSKGLVTPPFRLFDDLLLGWEMNPVVLDDEEDNENRPVELEYLIDRINLQKCWDTNFSKENRFYDRIHWIDSVGWCEFKNMISKTPLFKRCHFTVMCLKNKSDLCRTKLQVCLPLIQLAAASFWPFQVHIKKKLGEKSQKPHRDKYRNFCLCFDW